MSEVAPHDYEPIFVARQPIFDRKQDVWGYELLFRDKGHRKAAQISDPDMATSHIIADGYALAFADTDNDKKALINFPAALLLHEAAFALPKETCIIEILETVEPTPEIVKALQGIKNMGYTLALDDFVGQPGFEEIIALADIIKVEIMGMSEGTLRKITGNLQKHGKILLAEKIETWDEFQLCKELGYDYFQGFYFHKPVLIEGRKVSPNVISKMEILRVLAEPEFDDKRVREILSTDTSLSYRLLKFINSAAFDLVRKIQSIQQAMALLGVRQLRQWLMASVIADKETSPKNQELSFTVLQRARYLTLLSQSHMVKEETEPMFLLGLFSKLDVLYGLPMEKLMEDIPLDDCIKEALLGQKNRYYYYLYFIHCIEEGEFEKAEFLMGKLGIDREVAALKHAEALDWTKMMLAV